MNDMIVQSVILGVAILAMLGLILYLKKSKNKTFKSTTGTDVDTAEDGEAQKTANELINVKNIQNGCLHANDGYTYTFIEVAGMSMDLFSECEKIDYCRKLSSAVSRFRFPYRYIAISSPFSIKHKITNDSKYVENATGLCKEMLEDDINYITRLVIEENKIDRRFFIILYSDNEDEITIKKRTEEAAKAFTDAGVACDILSDNEIVKMYNLFTNPAYSAYERSDDIYLALSQIIALNNDKEVFRSV